jgi:hypothetical protein
MGFVPSSSTIQLYAYFTEYAREKIFNGEVIDFKVKDFSLHDEDINYIISKETIGVDSSGNTLYNTLKSGFLPDITGDIDTCVKSNKTSIVFGRNMLTGTTQVSTPVVFGCTNPLASNYNEDANFDDGSCIITTPQTRTLTIGFDQSSFNQPLPADDKKNHNHPFQVNLKALAGDTTGNANLQEALSTTFNIEIIPDYDTSLIQNVKTTTLNPQGFAGGNTALINLEFTKKNKIIQDLFLIEPVTIRLKLVPLQPNRIIEPGKDIYTYTKSIKWNQ